MESVKSLFWQMTVLIPYIWNIFTFIYTNLFFMSNIKVSVLIPVYNGAPFLKEALDSILNQTFTDFELILLNDASPDNSEEIIKQYNDDRIRYYRNKKI